MPGKALYGRDELARGVRLEKVSSGTCREHLPDQLLALVHGEHEHLDLRRELADTLCRFEAIQLRHREVQNGDVRVGSNRGVNSLAAIRSLRADGPSSLLLEQLLEPAPHNFMVVREEDAGRRETAPVGVGLSGMRVRVEQLKGTLEVVSGPSGTRVSAAIPVPITAGAL